MRYCHLALTRFTVVALSGFVLAATAVAAPVTMLQFGSFETRDEAQARLDVMKKKHAGVLGQLPSSIREIKLGADDLTVYRTQAGPLANRAAAQSVCAQLASNGDECYVVETSMIAGSPAAPVVPAPTPTPAAQAATTPEPPVKLQPIPQRDPRNVAALAQVKSALDEKSTASSPSLTADATLATASPVASTVIDATPTKLSPQLQSALDKAVAEQVAADKEPKKESVAPKPVADTRSFWSRANPFSDDAPEEEVKPAASKALAAAAVAATVSSASASNVEPEFPPPPVVTPQQLKAAAAAESASPTVIPASPDVNVAVAQPAFSAPAPVKLATSTTPSASAVALAPPVVTTQAPSMDLPPPPAPLIPNGARPLASVQPSAPISTGTMPFVAPLPVQQSINTPQVNVEEAKRVPLTASTLVSPPPEVASVPGPDAPPPTSLNLLPSASLGKKTVWAQMGKFEDTQTALAFWDQYRKENPDFPAVRVRVVSSYQAQQHGDETKWLRVGPFSRSGFVTNLCTSLDDMDIDDLKCGQVTDMGVASAPNRAPGYLPPSRYAR